MGYRDPSRQREYNLQHWKDNKATYNLRARERYSLWRSRVLVLLGGTCVCCGETETAFLAVDHIHGGGSKDKRVSPQRYWKRVFDYLTASGSRQRRYQILCHNCNHAKQFNPGGCPHGNC